MEQRYKSELLKRANTFARKYASWGWHVFPIHEIVAGHCGCKNLDCKMAGKHPAVRWSSVSSTDATKIDSWWNYATGVVYNVGIETGKKSGITVIDIDIDHGGEETWESVCAALKSYYGIDVPDTYTVKTGGGGWHFYFNYCPELKTATNVFGKGVDIRNDGGYVVAPPSEHKTTHNYEVYSGENSDQSKPVLADLPKEILKLIKPKVKDNTPKKASLDKVKKMLDFISSEDYTTWFNVGVILGSEFNKSDEAWALYQEWSDKGWDGQNKQKRDAIMHDAFHYSDKKNDALSEEEKLTIKSIYKMAYENGFTDVSNNFDINLFCYLASENVYIFMPTGEKWVASGVNNTIRPINDSGEIIKPSIWLAKNKAAINMLIDGSLPCGLIDGYYSKEGRLFPLPQTRVLNIFNFNDFKPLKSLMPHSGVNKSEPAANTSTAAKMQQPQPAFGQAAPMQQPSFNQAAPMQTAAKMQQPYRQTGAQSNKIVFKIAPELWAKLN